MSINILKVIIHRFQLFKFGSRIVIRNVNNISGTLHFLALDESPPFI